MSREDEELRRKLMDKVSRKFNRDRPVPPVWKKLTHMDWHRQFTWKQRIQVFFGYAVRVEVEMLSIHDPGKSAAKLTITTTKNTNPQEEIREQSL